MNTDIIVAILSGIVSIIVTVITVVSSSNKTRQEIRIQMAVHEEKIKTLSDEVRKHNDFASRLPVLEEKVDSLTGRVLKLEDR